MTAIYLYDDARARSFEPFALTRPVGELRAGALLIRERWERALGGRVAGHVGAAHLADFTEPDAAPVVRKRIPRGAVVANARFAPELHRARGRPGGWAAGGRIAAVRLTTSLEPERLADGSEALESLVPAGGRGRPSELGGWWLDEVWDLVGTLETMLAADIPLLAGSGGRATPAGCIRLGKQDIHVARGAVVEPQVCFDVSAGPVMVRDGAKVAAFTRLTGPCIIGERSVVLGGRIATSSVGDGCKVHGEVSHAVFLGHANKGHDGFVGHSYLGRWVNLGAGTTTSNLKNTYGSVALWTPAGVRSTGLQFLGTLFGDHVKTGIGMRLTTGTVVGAGANVYGAAMPPKAVPPFAWGAGAPYGEFELDKFLEVAERAMARRDVRLGEAGRRHLGAVHAARWRHAERS